MVQGKTNVQSESGIHARPAAKIATCVKKASSTVIFRLADGMEVDPGNYIKLMSLRIKCQDEVEIIVNGPDENEVFAELFEILQSQ